MRMKKYTARVDFSSIVLCCAKSQFCSWVSGFGCREGLRFLATMRRLDYPLLGGTSISWFLSVIEKSIRMVPIDENEKP
jgi:hypothetical protein